MYKPTGTSEVNLKSGKVLISWEYDSLVNEVAKACGGEFRKLNSGRKGWAFTAEQAAEFKAALKEHDAKQLKIAQMRGQVEAPKAEHIEWPVDGEKFAALATPDW
jgi:hypothetical protein